MKFEELGAYIIFAGLLIYFFSAALSCTRYEECMYAIKTIEACGKP